MASGAIVFDGNSLFVRGTVGSVITAPTQTMTLLGNPAGVTGTNIAVGGQTTSSMLNNEAANVYPLLSAGPTNLLVAWEITNELYWGEPAAHVFNRFVQYCTNARSKGFRVAALTVLPTAQYAPGVSPSYFEPVRQEVNALLRTWRTTFCDVLVDVGADTTVLGPVGANTNETYYLPDHIHLNNTGNGVVAQMIVTAITPYVL